MRTGASMSELEKEEQAVELLNSLGYSVMLPQERLFLIRFKEVNSNYFSYSTRKSTPKVNSSGNEPMYAEINLKKLNWIKLKINYKE